MNMRAGDITDYSALFYVILGANTFDQVGLLNSMGDTEFFEPNLGAYVRYVLGFCLRYFLFAGGFVCVFHLWGPRKWLVRKIQMTFPGAAEMRHEILWSMSNALCTGLSTMLVWSLIRDGHTEMYFNLADRGWLYFMFSVLVGIVGYDSWFYWQHRALHTPWLFRHAHAIHHRSHNPTPLATFAHHPIETFFGNAYFVLLVMVFPIHPLALGLVGLQIVGVGLIAHSGYEFYPAGFTRHGVLRWHNTSTHHNMHHSHIACNYGSTFSYWDRLMGSLHRDYDETFDAIKARGAQLGGVGARGVSTGRAGASV